MDIQQVPSWIPRARPPRAPEPINPEAWLQPDMREALAQRDIVALYRILQRFGVSQRRIAALTQQSQSEISEILHGRRVESYEVLVRIAYGLGVPRGWMGLAFIDQAEDVVPVAADGHSEH